MGDSILGHVRYRAHVLRRGLGFILMLTLGLCIVPLAKAVEPHERLSDPILEQRARDISRTLRCLVCQNESIDESSAPIAETLRLLVRKRLQEGDPDNAVIDHIVSRYGTYVLLKPPVTTATVPLWLSPLLALGLFLGLAWRYMRRHQQRGEP